MNPEGDEAEPRDGRQTEARKERRARERERVRRQRRTATGALAATVVATAAIGVLVLGGSDPADELGVDVAVATDVDATARPGQGEPRGEGPAPRGKRDVEPRAAAPARASEPPPGRSEPPGRRIPILMYHATEAPPADSPYPELWVPAERFADQMAALEAAGYQPITMRDAEDYWAGQRRIPRRPVVLTFDDGYRSHVEVALPELDKRGWPGVLYLEVAALRKPGSEGIGPEDVERLIAAGWELGAHTMTHPDLTTLDADRLREEVAGSRRALRRTFGGPVTAFCYPAGRHDDTVIAAVEDAGFTSATTVEPGLAGPPDTPFTRHRIRVNGSDAGETVVANIAAAGG